MPINILKIVFHLRPEGMLRRLARSQQRRLGGSDGDWRCGGKTGEGPGRTTWASVSPSVRIQRPHSAARVETRRAAPSPTTRKEAVLAAVGATRTSPAPRVAKPPASCRMAPRRWRLQWSHRSSLHWWGNHARTSVWMEMGCLCCALMSCSAATKMNTKTPSWRRAWRGFVMTCVWTQQSFVCLFLPGSFKQLPCASLQGKVEFLGNGVCCLVFVDQDKQAKLLHSGML